MSDAQKFIIEKLISRIIARSGKFPSTYIGAQKGKLIAIDFRTLESKIPYQFVKIQKALEDKGFDLLSILKEIAYRRKSKKFEKVMDTIFGYLLHQQSYLHTPIEMISVTINQFLTVMLDVNWQTNDLEMYLRLEVPKFIYSTDQIHILNDQVVFVRLTKPYSWHIPALVKQSILKWWKQARLKILKEG